MCFKFLFQLFNRAKTQDLEEQQPGVEGELRRLINKPGKTRQNHLFYPPGVSLRTIDDTEDI